MALELKRNNDGRTWDNVEDADWPEQAKTRLAQLVAQMVNEGEGVTIVTANYFEPRLYRDEYNRGSDREGIVYTTSRREVGLAPIL